MTQSEFDIVHEVFVPFNCRAFLTNMLSVGKEHLIAPRYRFHEELIKYLWPELLTEPFNPHEVAKRRRKNIQRKLSKLRTIPGGRVLYRFVPQSIKQLVKRLTT